MSGLAKGIGKAFKSVGKVVKKVAPYVALGAAVYFGAGALAGSFGGASAAAGAATAATTATTAGSVFSSVMTGLSTAMTGMNFLGAITGQQAPVAGAAQQMESPISNNDLMTNVADNKSGSVFTGQNTQVADASGKVPIGTDTGISSPSKLSDTQLVPKEGDASGGMLKSLLNNPGLFVAGGSILQGYGAGKSADATIKRDNATIKRDLDNRRVPKLNSVYSDKS